MRKPFTYLNRLPRVAFGSVDIALWFDLGWLKVFGYGIQWKHKRYLTRNPLSPVFQRRIGAMYLSLIKNGSIYQ